MAIIRAKAILLMLCLLILFNYGFMQLRLASVPLAEISLVLFLLTANISVLARRFTFVVNPIPFVGWWFFGIGSAIFYLNLNGIWALRDATNVIESLFVLVGFSIFSVDKVRNLIINKYPKFLFLLCIYALSYPLASVLQTLSPYVTAGAGHSVPILFVYTNSAMMLLLGALYLVVSPGGKYVFQRKGVLTAAFLLLFTVALFQARTIYVQIIALILILLIVKPTVAKQWFYIILGAFFLLLLVSFTGIEIEGRLGQKISADFLLNHFMAIFGIESEGLKGAADGVAQRFVWWIDIYDWWSESITSVVLGLGYGFPLVDFGISGDVMVREPHNSYISVLSRAGLLGFFFWIWLHYCLIKSWLFSYHVCKDVHWKQGEILLIILLAFFILVWCLALAEDGFEKPYNAVPYYFFWGIVIRISWYAKHDLINRYGIIAK